jgi:beta-galactosidase
VGNEVIDSQWHGPDYGVNQLKRLVEFVHKAEPSRKVTCALYPARAKGVKWDAGKAFDQSEPAEMSFAMDVTSCNYTQRFFARDHAKYPNLIFLISEAATNGGARAWFDFDHAYTTGVFYWGGIDYIGEAFGWPGKGWARGFVDTCGFIKPIGYYLASTYAEEPMVRIAVKDPRPGSAIVWNDVKLDWEPVESHWNWEGQQKPLTVYTYTNSETVELELNGKSLGVKKLADCPQMLMKWDVPFEAGTLKAIARKGGKVVATHELKTAGPAARIALECDRTALKADGQDLAHVRVVVTDARGVRVPGAENMVQFRVSGAARIAGVDNGDLMSAEPWQADRRKAYKGQALLVLRAERQAGRVEVTAQAEGLAPATLVLESRKP